MNRLKQFNDDSLYVIETAGGNIGIDLTAVDIMDKIDAIYKNFTTAQDRLKRQKLVLDKQEEGKIDELGISEKTRKIMKFRQDFIQDTCNGIDGLFGEGASDKIFYHEILGKPLITDERLMFFLEELLPEQLEQAGLKTEAYVKSRTSKEEREQFVDKKDDDILEVE